MKCELKNEYGYCKIKDKDKLVTCRDEPEEIKKILIDGVVFMELKYPKYCPLIDYLTTCPEGVKDNP